MTREQSIRKGSTKAKTWKPARRYAPGDVVTNGKRTYVARDKRKIARSAPEPSYDQQVAAFCATACPMQKRYVIGLKAGLALLHEMQQAGALRLPFAAYAETVELMRWALEQAPQE